jgi:hypothetical protein
MDVRVCANVCVMHMKTQKDAAEILAFSRIIIFVFGNGSVE